MAISGSLNFLSASLTGSSGTEREARINMDFVGLNTLIVDPISASLNTLGHGTEDSSSLVGQAYYNNSIQTIGTVDPLTAEPNQLNNLLLNRNGPYQHPMWKQIRGGEHPVARKLRLHNTMSIDRSHPDAKRFEIRRRDRRMLFSGEDKELIIMQDLLMKVAENKQPSSHANLKQYYEPSVVTKFKPFLYNVNVSNTPAIVKMPLMNQMTYFSNHELNESLGISDGNPNTGSIGSAKQDYYKLLHIAKDLGAENFIYSETIFPREINTYRNFKLLKPRYEEEPGLGQNGYDREQNRTFWRNHLPDRTARLESTGSRNRSADICLNSQGFQQHPGWHQDPSTSRHMAKSVALDKPGAPFGGSGPERGAIRALGTDLGFRTISYLENGIVQNGANLQTLSGALIQSDAYQPYEIALTSMWPLDVRKDVYTAHLITPSHLTAAFGQGGVHIGLTPNSLPANVLGRELGVSRHSVYLADTASAATYYTQFLTGTAGELAYSTKPTIFFYRHTDTHTNYVMNGRLDTSAAGYNISFNTSSFASGKAGDGVSGYVNPTASLQYNRHTYPYQTPFYATNRIIGRNPMYNSYSEFAQSIKTLGRDYSIIPEFRISDHIEYYRDQFELSARTTLPFYSINNLVKDSDLHPQNNKITRTAFLGGDDMLAKHKLDFLVIDGADITSSANAANAFTVMSASVDPDPKVWARYRYDDLAGVTKYDKSDGAEATWDEPSFKSDSGSVIFSQKYSHTDRANHFSYLLDQDDQAFENDARTIPQRITFRCHGVKKLLPYNGFYPVLRTTQVGNAFKTLWQDSVGLEGFFFNEPQGQGRPNVNMTGAFLQTILEPFMAPGLLYNSIKSGIAVDYPVYVNTAPTYYAPDDFGFDAMNGGEGQHLGRHGQVRHAFYSSSFYGGLHMMGSSRCHPAILTKMYNKRVPFEALYNPFEIAKITAPQTDGGASFLHMPTDFVDYERSRRPLSPLRTAFHLTGSPRVQLPKVEHFVNSYYGDYKYHTMINNFLCETMDFFLDDQSAPGVKFPVVVSDTHIGSTINFNQNEIYTMDVSLRMGENAVMCEGPRVAGIGHFADKLAFNSAGSSDFGTLSREAEGLYVTSPHTMRGYIYGPPMEIVGHIDADEVAADEYVRPSGTMRPGQAKTARVMPEDYAGYFGINLMDPAYQAHTPPYFYGRSSMIVTFDPTSLSSNTNAGSLGAIKGNANVNSFYFDQYVTGSRNSDRRRLAHQIPNPTDSTSSGSLSRMKIEASLDFFDAKNLVQIVRTPPQGSVTQQQAWYMAPKWICPVLDFSSSLTPYKERYAVPGGLGENPKFKERVRFVENTFHNVHTGRGLWGGYGYDPYDAELTENLKEKLIQSNTMTKAGADAAFAEKGVYLSFGEYVESSDDNFQQQDNIGFSSNRNSNDATFIDRSNVIVTPTGSLSGLLGFQPRSYQIGRMASKKMVHEGIVIIPYFEEEVRVAVKNPENIPGGELFQTREIIAGKHFLPIHKTYFENVLSVMLTKEKFPSFHPTRAAMHNGKVFPASPDAAVNFNMDNLEKTDVGTMIRTLLGFNAVRTNGFQLPPEFDFVRNASVDPFQMIVIPFSHLLRKQELVDIYQGIMPHSSTYIEKVIKEITVEPAQRIQDMNIEPVIPRIISPVGTGPNAPSRALYEVANFLSPQPVSEGFRNSLSFFIDQNNSTSNIDIFDSKEFYNRLRFMVFKVKQNACKDYRVYRERQIAQAIEHQKIRDLPNSNEYSLKGSQELLLRNTIVGETYGANWPYDYFSLIETAKIDIEFEVLK